MKVEPLRDMAADQRVLSHIRNEVLEPGEDLLWQGRPSVRAAVRIGFRWFAVGVWLILSVAAFFALLVVMGFVPLILFLMHEDTSPWFWVLWFGGFLYFLLYGLWGFTGPLRYARRARRTIYFITNQRVLIVTAGWRMRVQVKAGEDIGRYRRVSRKGGTTNIFFRTTRKRRNEFYTFVPRFVDGLWGIEDVKGAEAALLKLSRA